MPDEKIEADSWLANEADTHEILVFGKKVIFKSKPSGSMVDHVAARFRNEPDKANFELVKYLVIDPRIDDSYWNKLQAAVRMQVLQECLNICGLQPGFLR